MRHRRHRNVILVAVVLLSALTVCQVSAWSKHQRRISSFHVTKRLPASMVAGSTYETAFTFLNPKQEKAYMRIVLEITEKDSLVGFAEFQVEATLHTWSRSSRGRPTHYCVDLSFTEASGGVFESRKTVKAKSTNYITIKICSVPNLMPGAYTFTLTVSLHYEK